MPNRMGKVTHIHFIGIGGVGMSGIAEVLHTEGYEVSGSDSTQTAITERLKGLGIHVYHNHAAENIDNADVVVYSSAIHADNPEMQAAKQKRVALVPRAQMLAELMRFRYGIAVAGTHGKTTTTSLLASVFAQAGCDPTFVIGGKLNSADAHAQLGKGRYLIAEADESDASFLFLKPVISVVTNIDRDHMQTYHGDFETLRKTFLNFIHQVPFYGVVVLCIDDPVIAELIPEINRPVITYGFSDEADVRATHYQQDGLSCRFECHIRGQSHLIHLNIPGRHNALNALATIAIATEEDVPMEHVQKALSTFEGIGRRFQSRMIRLPDSEVMLIDDYGHHPKEIQATMQTIREGWPDDRLVLVFQPHRYTRTIELFDDFAQVLSKADVLVLLEVYPAGEKPIKGADARDLIRAIRSRSNVDAMLVSDTAELPAILNQLCKTGDKVVMQGAGNIGQLCWKLWDDYAIHSQEPSKRQGE